MKKLKISDVKAYVNTHIHEFHQNKLKALEKIKLITLLKKKNPYLFKAKNILVAHDLVKTILDAYLSSQEETIFGDFLEGLAIFINQKVYSGKKSSAHGIDLEFEKNGIKYIVTIKSGPNWGNSGQIREMIINFKTAKKILKTSRSKINVVAINGCCYGRNINPDKGDYLKLCGQEFWSFISGNDKLYIDIIEPLGYKAKENNDKFKKSYNRMINIFTLDFSQSYCIDGVINWEELVKLNSSKK